MTTVYFKLDKQLLNIRFLLYNSMQGTKIVTVLEHVEMACCKSANLSLGSAGKLRADRRSQLVLLDSVVIPAAVVYLHPVVPHFQELVLVPQGKLERLFPAFLDLSASSATSGA